MEEKNQKNSEFTTPHEVWVTDFDTSSAIDFKKEIFEKFEENPNKPIIININSDGGPTDGLFLMLDAMDAIRSVANPNTFRFITVAIGRAMSAGAILLSHGDIRFATVNSTIMIHPIQAGTWGPKPDMDVEFNEIVRVNDSLFNILVNNCDFKGGVEEAKKMFNRNTYFTPTKAKEFGIIDVVGYPKVNEIKVYELVVCSGLPEEPKVEVKELKTKKTEKVK